MKGYSWGGSEELWFATAQAALQNNHKVLVSAFESSIVSPKFKELESRGVEVHFRKWISTPSSLTKRVFNRIKRNVVAEPQPLSHVARFNPDVIYWSCANSFDAAYHPEVPRFLKTSKFNYAIICQGHNDEPFFNQPGERLAVKKIYENAMFVGFVSNALRASAKRLIASPIDNGIVVRNPVNLSKIDAVPYPEVVGDYRFAIVARIDAATKSHDVLLEAFGQPQWRERNWTLSIVGSGSSQEYLEDLSRLYKIENRVKFVGHATDIRKIWAEHHALVLPSRYEGTPLAMVEAMLCQRMAVVTDIGGMPEWITDEVNGFVAEAAFVKYLGNALERAWERRGEWESLGEKARETALRQFDPSAGETILKYLTEALTKLPAEGD